VLEIIRPLDKDEARVGEALRLALLVSAAVSGVLLGGEHAPRAGVNLEAPDGENIAPRTAGLAGDLLFAVRKDEGGRPHCRPN
jgi:hypothetical protein